MSRLVELRRDVWVATSRRYATTSTVLLDGRGGAIVIDPAWDPDELAALPLDVAALGVTCVAGLATHEHYDHVMWHPGLGRVPRWSTATTVDVVEAGRDAIDASLAEFLTPDLIRIAGRLTRLPGDLLPWDGPGARVLVHDAHAPGHLALVVEEWGLVVAGDMLSDVELPMPAGADTTLETYLAGLDSLRAEVARAQWLIPGHGTPTNRPLERYDADLRYLDGLLRGRPVDDPRIGMDGMAELHAQNVARARHGRGSSGPMR